LFSDNNVIKIFRPRTQKNVIAAVIYKSLFRQLVTASDRQKTEYTMNKHKRTANKTTENKTDRNKETACYYT